jgi:hypothetical protein
MAVAVTGCSSAGPDALVAKATGAKVSSVTDARISVTLRLNTNRQVAGRPIYGTYVVVNRTGAAIESGWGGGCGGPGIGIENARTPLMNISLSMACAPRVLFPVGRSVAKVTIFTTYQTGVATGNPPTLPALPAGTYATKVMWGDQMAPVPDPRPIRVELVAP